MTRIALVALALLSGCASDPDIKDTPARETSPVAECPATTGVGTLHKDSEIKGEEVWTAAGSPHIVEYDLNIRGGAKLTIEPCR